MVIIKARLNLTLFILLILLIIFGGITIDRYRWHEFQRVTHSDIGYFKWKFVFDNKGSSKR